MFYDNRVFQYNIELLLSEIAFFGSSKRADFYISEYMRSKSKGGIEMGKVYTVGNGVEMNFDNGAVELRSPDGGTISPEWLEIAKIPRSQILSIRVTGGKVFLPENAEGFNFDDVHSSMFGCLKNVKEICMNGFDSSRATKMNDMFCRCKNLVSLDLRGINTSNVKNMFGMFSGCKSLTGLDLNGFETSSVTDMACMFIGCSGLTNLDLSSFNTSNVMNMGSMFFHCDNLASLDLSSFDTSKVTSMEYMFNDCYNLKELDLSGFDISNIHSMMGMFVGCESLRKVIMHQTVSTDVITDRIFEKCHADLTIQPAYGIARGEA